MATNNKIVEETQHLLGELGVKLESTVFRPLREIPLDTPLADRNQTIIDLASELTRSFGLPDLDAQVVARRAAGDLQGQINVEIGDKGSRYFKRGLRLLKSHLSVPNIEGGY